MPGIRRWYTKCCDPLVLMDTEATYDQTPAVVDGERWLALGAGAVLLLAGASQRSLAGVCVAACSAPLLYRGVTGHWPALLDGQSGSSREALSGGKGVHVRESIRLNKPVAEVYRFWRRLENLPRFMTHLESVTDIGGGKSHWVAEGPAGLAVEWDAEIINEVENEVIGWQSLPESDVVTAGSVNFDSTYDGHGTEVSAHLQYAPPAGKAGALVARLFGREPSQTIREDLQRLKQVLEAGEMPR